LSERDAFSKITYAKELLADLTLEEKSMDDYPAYLQEPENLGLKDYTNIMQARRDRITSAD
jgi:hypothetical protein